MSSVVSAITGGGGKGVNFEAEKANVINPVSAEQQAQGYANAQTGLQQQQAFLNAIQAQNGLGNQSSVFNQMQGVANGTGPNPAQAMLNNSTGANVANTAALMAGQRGAGQNAGMIGRQAGMAGANIQQNAAGQAAAMQAQQSLGALNQMGNIANNQANMQSNATNAYTNAAQAEQGQLLGAVQGVNNANVGAVSGANAANAGIQGQVAKGQMDLVGGIASGAGKAAMLMAEGGIVDTIKNAFSDDKPKPTPTPIKPPRETDPKGAKGISDYFNSDKYAEGGGVPLEKSQGATSTGPQSRIGQFFSGMDQAQAPQAAQMTPTEKGGQDLGEGLANMAESLFAKGGKVPAMVSPGETYLPPDKVKEVKKGANPLEVGEKIPGKPKVKGNSYANDTVHKDLDAGGVVIPNSIMQSKDASEKAAKFVAAILKKQSLKKGK